MTDHPGSYPSGQVCYPPELPTYLKEVCDLKPIVGVPTDDQLVGIHAVIQTANRALGIPGMHDPGLVMRLANHMFDVQMAKYRSKYSLITFPSDATYTPPTLPSHISANLRVVTGAPSDDEIMRVQNAVRSYQHFSGLVPSMFDPQINMELSQHLFDLQMARHMQVAGNTQPTIISPEDVGPISPAQITKRAAAAEGLFASTNNAGTGAHAPVVHRGFQPTAGGVSQEIPLRSKDHSREMFGDMSLFSIAIRLWSAAIGVCIHYVGALFIFSSVAQPFFSGEAFAAGSGLFVFGLALVMGPTKAFHNFTRPRKLHGTICLVCGTLWVYFGFFGHRWVGFLIEVFGFFTVFGDLFPGVI
ncbi:unnamed protein product [Rhizoctonia solani]|uniref:Uncharacterized protein n=1 Tax=Rhizoctonia solani TaxID=456999 RepID=A0A8H3D2Q4_9AGAM|nr:unnamed protein product [Rhizoctonia solani]